MENIVDGWSAGCDRAELDALPGLHLDGFGAASQLERHFVGTCSQWNAGIINGVRQALPIPGVRFFGSNTE